jgi:serine/threonine protein kinase
LDERGLLEGETLREVLVRRTPTQRQILGFTVQAARGLAAARRKGVVHRDLEPENLFLTILAKLKSLTNLRAVRDPEAPEGWSIQLAPFPGWKDVPSW